MSIVASQNTVPMDVLADATKVAAQNNEAVKKLALVEAERDALTQQTESLKQQLNAVRKEKVTREDLLVTYRTRIESLEANVNAYKRDLEKVAGADAKNASLITEVEGLQRQLKERDTTIATLQSRTGTTRKAASPSKAKAEEKGSDYDDDSDSDDSDSGEFSDSLKSNKKRKGSKETNGRSRKEEVVKPDVDMWESSKETDPLPTKLQALPFFQYYKIKTFAQFRHQIVKFKLEHYEAPGKESWLERNSKYEAGDFLTLLCMENNGEFEAYNVAQMMEYLGKHAEAHNIGRDKTYYNRSHRVACWLWSGHITSDRKTFDVVKHKDGTKTGGPPYIYERARKFHTALNTANAMYNVSIGLPAERPKPPKKRSRKSGGSSKQARRRHEEVEELSEEEEEGEEQSEEQSEEGGEAAATPVPDEATAKTAPLNARMKAAMDFEWGPM